jgi:hypothetical protein
LPNKQSSMATNSARMLCTMAGSLKSRPSRMAAGWKNRPDYTGESNLHTKGIRLRSTPIPIHTLAGVLALPAVQGQLQPRQPAT